MSRLGNGSRRAQLFTRLLHTPCMPCVGHVRWDTRWRRGHPITCGTGLSWCTEHHVLGWETHVGSWGDLSQILGRHPGKAMLRPGAGVSWGWQELKMSQRWSYGCKKRTTSSCQAEHGHLQVVPSPHCLLPHLPAPPPLSIWILGPWRSNLADRGAYPPQIFHPVGEPAAAVTVQKLLHDVPIHHRPRIWPPQ